MDSQKYACKYCCKLFNDRRNFSRHTKNIHKRDSKDKIISHIERKKYSCVLCDKVYADKRSLDKHVNNIHLQPNKIYSCNQCNYETKYKSSLTKHIKKVHKPISVPRFNCSKCNASFIIEKRLNYHIRKDHNNVKASVIFKKKCPLCPYISIGQSNKDICSHFNTVHHIPICIKHLKFHSTLEFDTWKNEIEKATVACFRKNCTYLSSSKKTETYHCHRSGMYICKGSNKRKLKHSGSSKINGYCPSSIKAVYKDSDEVHVSYLPCHVGHINEFKHIRLTKEEKKYTALQLATVKPSQNELVEEFIGSDSTAEEFIESDSIGEEFIESASTAEEFIKSASTVKEFIESASTLKEFIESASTVNKCTTYEEVKIKVDTAYQNLQGLTTTREQMEYVYKELTRITTTVEGMNKSLSSTSI